MNSSIGTQGDLGSQRSKETEVVQTQEKSILQTGKRRARFVFYILCVCCFGTIVYITIRKFNAPSRPQIPKVSISSEPEHCMVVINGQSIGPTPINDYEVQTGTIMVGLSKEGYTSKDSTFIIHDADNIRLTFALEENIGMISLPEPENVDEEKPVLMGSLNVNSIPPSMIYVDNELRASPISSPSEFSIATGKHFLRFESVNHGSYGNYKMPVFIRENTTTTITCYFESYVNFGVRGESEWGTIMIDGKSIEHLAPIAHYPLSAGKHRIIVSRKGYDTIEGERVIEITPSLEQNVISLIFTLKKRESL